MLRLAEGFELELVACASPHLAEALIQWLTSQLGADGLEPAQVRTHRVAVEPGAGPVDTSSIGRDVLDPLVTDRGARLVFLDVSSARRSDEQAWRWMFQRLNERRNGIATSVNAPLVIIMPPWLETALPAEAPDLWSIRSAAVEIVDQPPALEAIGVSERVAPPVDDLRGLETRVELRRSRAASGLPGDREAYARALRHYSESVLDRIDLATLGNLIDRDLMPLVASVSDPVERARMYRTQALLRAQEERFDEAISILRERALPLLEEETHAYERALMVGTVARILEMRGDSAAALRVRLEEELPTYRRLQADSLLAITLIQVGDLHRNLGDFASARASYEEALDRLQRELPVDEPQRLRTLATVQRSLGLLQWLQGDTAGARDTYESALARLQLIAEQAPEQDVESDLAVTLAGVGGLNRSIGDDREAQRAYEAALAIRRRQAARSPESRGVEQSLAVALEQLGSVAPDPEALAACREAAAIRRHQVSIDPDRTSPRRDLALTLLQVARRVEGPEREALVREAADLLAALHHQGKLDAEYNELMQALAPWLESPRAAE